MAVVRASGIWEALRSGRRLLSDGAVGTELIRRGVVPEEMLSANVTIPDVVQATHAAYAAVGADILTANTFGIEETARLQEQQQAGIQRAFLAAMESDGHHGVWFTLRPETLLRQTDVVRHVRRGAFNPDMLLLETCVNLSVAEEAVAVALLLTPKLLAVTCHFRDDGRMPDGTTPEAVAEKLIAAGAHVIGANCGETPENFPDIAAKMRAVTASPLLFQPSAGLPTQNAGGAWEYPIGPEPFAEIARQLYAAGANIVGGCCGTTPDYIAAAHRRCLSFLTS
jgi:5-methyltetrahydrofolate--homocysteine methyltransferase